ncbi:FtsW/RodA/SpoVE family cell cycle protein [Pseudoduganella aquatica]|uniref:FtsW/RodA/SpoVE family cell cycle protein n=1 Tax=Pseudoduganella aquatica TaxID=2660641 RepID=UPI001E3C662B|nr:FtsW/RodA/SpoVE family cell cycle protein [Pseudoduganella aquatica]
MRNRLLAATAAALLVLTALQAWSLLRAPAAWSPTAIEIRLAPGVQTILGARELAAPQAERAHIQLRRDAQGAWLLRNLSASRPVVLHGPDGDKRMGSAALAGLGSFQIGGTVFALEQAGAGREAAFHFGGSAWRYDGVTLYRDGSAQPACPDASAAARITALWNRVAPGVLTLARPLAFGGNIHCGNRLGLGGIAPGAAILARSGGQLVLNAGPQDDGHTALRTIRNAAANAHAPMQASLRQEERPLAGVNSFSIGRTRFLLGPQPGAVDGDALNLEPSRHLALFASPESRLPPGVSWQWRQRTLLGIADSPAILALLAMAIAAQLLAHAGGSRRTPAARAVPAPGAAGAARLASAEPLARAVAAAALLAAGIAAIVAQRAGHPASAACSLLLGASALACWLLTPRRLPLPLAAALVLLAAGLLAQLELGLGASVSSWLRYYQKSTALLAAGSGASALWHLSRTWRRSALAVTPQRTMEWLLAVLAAVALAALAAQVLWGDETGVFDLQPVELAKLALTALTAHCLALRMSWNDGGHRQPGHAARWLQLAAPALLFLALLAFALVQVDDFSPLILLLVWTLSMAFAYALAARRPALAAVMACGALSAIAVIAVVRGAGAEGVAQWPLASSFYADRFQVWLAPAAHPHTGQQLLLGAHAIAEGGWLGADNMLGLRSLGLPVGAAVNIPAVQDDFAPAFFLNRHGLIGAVLLWAAQAALVAGLLHVAARTYAAATLARDFRQAWLGRFRYFALCGGAAFVLGHLLLSWGTNLAIFPIMGQPMSFLSAGGSHLLFFLCPLLACCAVSAQSLEENEHADLRPT